MGIISILFCSKQMKMQTIPLNLDSVILLMHNSRLASYEVSWRQLKCSLTIMELILTKLSLGTLIKRFQVFFYRKAREKGVGGWLGSNIGWISVDIVVVSSTLGRYLIDTLPLVYRCLIDTRSILGRYVGRSSLL